MFAVGGRKPYVSISSLWALSLLFVWIVVALTLGQSLWAQQSSRDLVVFGAIRNATFSAPDAWRLLASQWLHVKFAHMLLNAAIIAMVGTATERRLGVLAPMVGLIGGMIGQLAAIAFEPHGFASGASQAYMALCGLALWFLPWRSPGGGVAIAGVLIGVGLDIVVSGHGGLKPGHVCGLAVGLVAGGLLRLTARRRKDAQ